MRGIAAFTSYNVLISVPRLLQWIVEAFLVYQSPLLTKVRMEASPRQLCALFLLLFPIATWDLQVLNLAPVLASSKVFCFATQVLLNIYRCYHCLVKACRYLHCVQWRPKADLRSC